eukprot:543439_1
MSKRTFAELEPNNASDMTQYEQEEPPSKKMKQNTTKNASSIKHIDINFEHFDDYLDDLNQYQQQILKLQQSWTEFKISLSLGSWTADCVDWFDDIPHQILTFFQNIKDKIVSLTIGFDPRYKNKISIAKKTTGSSNLDFLLNIIANMSHLTHLDIQFTHHNVVEMYGKTEKSVNYYCIWI